MRGKKTTIYALRMQLVKIECTTNEYGATVAGTASTEETLRESHHGSFAPNLSDALRRWDRIQELPNAYKNFDRSPSPVVDSKTIAAGRDD